MPLRNRVTPFGDIIATPARGTMLGNRGILHDGRKEIVRTAQVRRWICCVLAFKGIRRVVMTPHTYTELFFLDEATALSAGHRPCFECRRPSAVHFQRCWAEALGVDAKADAMDRVLDSERRGDGGGKKTYRADILGLPAGTFISRNDAAWLLYGGQLLRWTPVGYSEREDRGVGMVDVLTPPATVAVLRRGYPSGVHASALQLVGG